MQSKPHIRASALAAALALAACSTHGNSIVGTPGGGGGTVMPDARGTPTPTIAFIPTSLRIRGTGAENAQTFIATDTQQNFTGTFTAASTNAAIATVSPLKSSGAQSATFTVTPVALGTCSIKVSDKKTTEYLKVTVIPAHGIFVTNRGSESFEAFALTANGDVAPMSTWKGSNTQLNT